MSGLRIWEMKQNLNEEKKPCGRVQQAVCARMEEERQERKSRRRWAAQTVVLLLLIFLLFRVLFGAAVVQGNSMNPNYQDSDVVLFTRVHGTLARGDVILIRETEDLILIKRVVGLPGEEVFIDQRTGTVMINGEEPVEDYAQGNTRRSSIQEYPITLGENEYFVLGDNREDSMDSRDYGPIPSEQVEGKVLATLRKN